MYDWADILTVGYCVLFVLGGILIRHGAIFGALGAIIMAHLVMSQAADTAERRINSVVEIDLNYFSPRVVYHVLTRTADPRKAGRTIVVVTRQSDQKTVAVSVSDADETLPTSFTTFCHWDYCMVWPLKD